MTTGIRAVLILEALVLAMLLGVALDLRAHSRVETLGGVNVRGYRGRVMPQKRTREIRLEAVGGDFAFGWGVAPGETSIAELRRLVALDVDRPGTVVTPVTAVNVAAIGLRPSGYPSWIDRYADLRPDLICIMVDSRSHRTAGVSLQPDRDSTAFALFGYAPILPLVLQEKGALLDSRLLAAVGTTGMRVDHAIGRLFRRGGDGHDQIDSVDDYVRHIENAIRAALRQASRVIVVAGLYETMEDVADHRRLSQMITMRFQGGSVKLVNLSDSSAMDAGGLWLAPMILSVAGQGRVAELVAPSALELLHRR